MSRRLREVEEPIMTVTHHTTRSSAEEERKIKQFFVQNARFVSLSFHLSSSPPPGRTHPRVGRHHERAFVVLLGGRAVRI